MKADIMACYGNSFLDKLIQIITNSKVSHIAIKVDEEHMIESVGSGVRLSLVSSKTYYNLRCLELTEEQRDLIIDFVNNKLGTKFDFKLMLGIGLNRVFGWNTIWDNKDKYICIELIIQAYKSIGIELVDWELTEKIVPGDLLKSSKLSLI